MGEVWRAHPAWRVVEEAESVVGEPLAPLLLEASDESLARTRDAQLAVMLVSLMAWDAVRERIPEPVAFAGHSLGQVTALVAAGALDVGDGVRLAARRAECTQQASDRRPGRMTALIGATVEQADEACRPEGPGVEQTCWVANDNAPGQVVVGGTPEGVEQAAERARRLGVRKVVPLKVGGAFHTPLMEEARRALVPHLAAAPLRPSVVPVVSNVDGRAHRDGDGWRQRLAEHLVCPVQWRASTETLVAMGASTLLEVGPGTVLSGLARRTAPEADVRSVAVPGDVPALMEVA
jgi:[acyl-carrier-protein] S-malonyltransferase